MKKEHLLVMCAVIVFCTIFFGAQYTKISPHVDMSTDEYGVSGELYITPFGVEEMLIDVLSETKYTLFGWHYQITYKEIITLLKNKAILGTDVKLLLENKTYGGSSQLWDAFRSAVGVTPVQVKNDEDLGTNFIHAKSFVTDTAFIVSTANLGYPGFFKNREYRFVSRDPAVVSAMKYVFERDWEGGFIRSRWLPEGVVMCPVNCRDSVMHLLGSAKESIKIQAQYITDDLIIELLKNKQSSGVELTIIVSDRQEIAPLIGLNGVHVLAEPYVHAKNILVDDELLFVGSMNLSQNAIENNREMNIITSDDTAIRRFNGQFLVDVEDTIPFESDDWGRR